MHRLGSERRRDFFALLRGSRWHGACFRIDGQRGSFVRLLASITEIAAESSTVTDGIQDDPVSHRTRLNQPQVAACSATIIDWLTMYGLTNIYRLIGNARHIVLAATRETCSAITLNRSVYYLIHITASISDALKLYIARRYGFSSWKSPRFLMQTLNSWYGLAKLINI